MRWGDNSAAVWPSLHERGIRPLSLPPSRTITFYIIYIYVYFLCRCSYPKFVVFIYCDCIPVSHSLVNLFAAAFHLLIYIEYIIIYYLYPHINTRRPYSMVGGKNDLRITGGKLSAVIVELRWASRARIIINRASRPMPLIFHATNHRVLSTFVINVHTRK